MGSRQPRAYQPLSFWRRVDPENCSYNNRFSLGWWRVLSCAWTFDRVKAVDIMFPARKSAGINKFISNDYCRICRINLKINGHSKINIFENKRDNEEFLNKIVLTSLYSSWHLYICRSLFGRCRFTRVVEAHFMLCNKQEFQVELSRKIVLSQNRRVHALSCIMGNQDKIVKKQRGK